MSSLCLDNCQRTLGLGGKGGVGWAATAVVCWSCVLFFQGVCLGVDHGGVAIGVWLFSGAFVL